MKISRNDYWKRSVVYQIYPKSFKSYYQKSTGDLKGVIDKLDYLSFLGVDFIWLTPIYKSPQKDNGYDISDYYTIDESYGTMEDFELLVKKAKEKNIKIMMDIVVNHTSIEHPWFKESAKDQTNPYRNYYIWRDSKNNWKSKFGGSAWEYHEQTEQYYLHLFDKTQADLNWEKEELRYKIYNMIKFWIEKGVGGFRLDVINLISKCPGLPDDKEDDGRLYYTDGPKVHFYLKEMYKEVFEGQDLITVGEMSSTTVENCIQYSNPDEKELNMTFNFHHLKVDYDCGDKWTDKKFDFIELKRILSRWQVEIHKGKGWNALFWCNHDQPRVISRFGNEGIYHRESGKMLATTIHLMQGTPYIYQGEEIGMTNAKFAKIENYLDVETLNQYQIKREQGVSEDTLMRIIAQKSRDNSRTPMQWDSSTNAGFSISEPWIKVTGNYQKINVENALNDEDSILYHYKKLIKLRKEMDIITYGDYQLLLEDHPAIFAYIRGYKNERLLIINNFSENESIFELPNEINWPEDKSRILLSNYECSNVNFRHVILRPYESIVYYVSNITVNV